MSQKRKQITLEQKLDILKRFKLGEKAVDIARNLGLAPSTIKSICSRDAEKIKKFAETATSLQHKQVTKIRSNLMEKMESLLTIWIEQNQRRVPLSQMVIQNKARAIFEDLKENCPLSSAESSEEFEGSRGWFDRFRSRANLQSIPLKGEAASADYSSAEKLKAIIEEGGYSPQQVFNVDETGLSWKEVKESCMNGTWRQLCPDCIRKDMEYINDSPQIYKELTETANNVNFSGMEEQDIHGLILYDEEMNNESLIAIQSKNALDDEALPLDVEVEEKKLTAAKISEAMQLISQAMDILENNDPDEDRSSKVARTVADAMNCYKKIYLKKKSVTIQKTR